MPVGYLTYTGRLAAMACDLPKGKSYRAKISSAMLNGLGTDCVCTEMCDSAAALFFDFDAPCTILM